jgi:hypothetical protein
LFFTIPFEGDLACKFARAMAITGSSRDEPAPARDEANSNCAPGKRATQGRTVIAVMRFRAAEIRSIPWHATSLAVWTERPLYVICDYERKGLGGGCRRSDDSSYLTSVEVIRNSLTGGSNAIRIGVFSSAVPQKMHPSSGREGEWARAGSE